MDMSKAFDKVCHHRLQAVRVRFLGQPSSMVSFLPDGLPPTCHGVRCNVRLGKGKVKSLFRHGISFRTIQYLI